MSWTDTKSVEAIKYLRDRFQVKEFIETGTFKGINARRHSKNFEKITTCEIKQEYFTGDHDRHESTKKSTPQKSEFY